MFLNYRTRGLILEKENREEADQLLTIYTKDFGKIKILAKAVRKISSKLRAGAEIFYLSDIEFIQAKRQKTLIDAVAVEKFKNLRQDLNRLKVAHQIARSVEGFIKGPEADERIWKLLLKVSRKLNSPKISTKDAGLIYRYFLSDFLSILGYGVKVGRLSHIPGL